MSIEGYEQQRRGPEPPRGADPLRALISRRRMLQRAAALGVALPAGGALLAACGDDDDAPSAPTSSTAPFDPPQTVTYGGQAKSEYGLLVAQAMGYFEEEGLEVKMQEFFSPQDIFTAMAANQVEIATTLIDAAVFNAIDRGIDMRIVAPLTTNGPTNKAQAAFIVRNQLKDEVKEIADLKGRKMNLISNSLSERSIEDALASADMTFDDVTRVNLAFPEWYPSLQKGAVDFLVFYEPFITLGEQEGIWYTLEGLGPYTPDGLTQVVMSATEKFINDRPEVLERFLYACMKGQRDVWRVFDKGQKGALRKKVVDTLSKTTYVEDPKMWNVLIDKGTGGSGQIQNGEIDAGIMQDGVEWLRKKDYVKSEFNVRDALDLSFIKTAVDRLGRID